MVSIRVLSGLLSGLSGIVLSLGIAPIAAADWTEFRGSGGQGLVDVTALPLTWSEESHVVWKEPVEGLAWSSPVIANGRIYLTSAIATVGDGHVLTAQAREFDTGAVVWSKPLCEQSGPVQMHSKNSHASPTPIIDGDRLYVHFGPHYTGCLSTETGAVLWETRLEYEPRHGTGGSPALFEDLLVICCDGGDRQFVVGLDKQTGEERWRTPRDTSPVKGFSFCTPLIIHVNDQPQAVCPGSDAVFAYDPRTGTEIWRVRYGDGYSVVPRPVFAQGLVFVCSGYDRAQLFAIDPSGRGDVTDSHVRWSTDRAVPHNPSPIVVGRELYMVSDGGIATCLDALTGEQRWQERFGGKFSASPVATSDRVYFQDEAGKSYVVATGTSYQLLAANEWADGMRTYASYAVAGDSLVLRSESHLYRIAE